MGRYTEHWQRHRTQSLRGTLHALLLLGVGVPTIAGIGFLLQPLTNVRTALLVACIVAWLAGLVTIVLRASRVTCPRCSTRYARGAQLVNCPSCGLRMFQEDP